METIQMMCINNEYPEPQKTKGDIIRDIIEDVQEAHMIVGGRFLRCKEVEEMPFRKLLELLVFNGAEINIKINREL